MEGEEIKEIEGRDQARRIRKMEEIWRRVFRVWLGGGVETQVSLQMYLELAGKMHGEKRVSCGLCCKSSV